MATSSSKPSNKEQTSFKKNDKLNSIFEEIVTKVAVDLNNPEIIDIQSAVSEMLERIKTRINERGVFSISRILPSGSMAEKTSMWKFDGWPTEQPFIEFDFIAVLQATCDIKPDCEECFCVNTLPARLKQLEKYYPDLYSLYLKSERLRKDILKECFIRETNDCIASCECLHVEGTYPDNHWKEYMFVPSSSCSKALQGCDKCIVDRPTGTIRVKSSVEIGKWNTKCTLMFVWTSKAKTLCSRDKWSLPTTEKMDSLTIYIDFLPALEVFQLEQQSADIAACSSAGLVLNPTSSEYVHYRFLVPKHCVVCDKIEDKDTWRRSGCRKEIDIFVKKMSSTHRKCHQVLKYLVDRTRPNELYKPMNSYYIKVAVLHHNSSCSDADQDCAKCMFKLLDDIQQAYETRHLKSFHSQSNLLEDVQNYEFVNNLTYITLQRESMNLVSESESLSSFLEKVAEQFYEAFS